MMELSRHGEWLSLIDVSGPFLAEPVLKQVFPQGLEQTDPVIRKHVRQAYDEWREAVDTEDSEVAAIHGAWIDLVLKRVLELDENDEGDVLKRRNALPDSLAVYVAEHEVALHPDYAVVDAQSDDRSLLFVTVYPPDTDLSVPVKTDRWAASPAERMVELCRAHDARLGLVTNGERWMLVDAPIGGVTTYASWYARLWGQEPITLQAFVNLLGIRRFFVDDSERLPALLDASLKLQDEVTDALGEQVRRAIEVLVQALDRADVDRNRELLADVEPPELYEAALTVLMRIVFLLSAEERGLLLLDDEAYQACYAVSTLRMQLRAESEEILERRQDAWSRLLAMFRAVYGGIEHEALKLPALGGSLFDPDRFPFLEGRAKGTTWKERPAAPLPIDNRTVLLLLDAVQLFEGRALSYRALDAEQIGYVYEGLLERTVARARQVTLDLSATKNAKTPWVTLRELEAAAAKDEETVRALLEDRTGSSANRVKSDLAKKTDEAAGDRLLTACHGDQDLRDRIKPYLNFLRVDRWGYPLVYPEGTFMVTAGPDRRETGTHYTPKFLTEAIVKETLEPVVYVGPAEGKPRSDWKLKSPSELLDLKICDPAMGSGAFLVQVCRWLSERLVEAWGRSEDTGNSVTAEGVVIAGPNGAEPLLNNLEERLLTARRLIAERCLYGVDVNPLAVELAKLSLWLVTLAKGRPFGFLDHNLRSGDSLLGIHDLDQLRYLDMKHREGTAKKLFATNIDEAIETAAAMRIQLRNQPIRDVRDVEIMATLNKAAQSRLSLTQLIADALVGNAIVAGRKEVDNVVLSILAGEAITGRHGAVDDLSRHALKLLNADLPPGKSARQPYHWPLEFPEVFSRNDPGFDAIVGNPPFKRGKDISGVLGNDYREYLVDHIAHGVRGSADIVAYFFLLAEKLLRKQGCFGLLSTNTISEGDTREVCLDTLLQRKNSIYGAYPNIPWPGRAAVTISRLHVIKGHWSGPRSLAKKQVRYISSYLSQEDEWIPKRLQGNKGLSYQGSNILGLGFTMPIDSANAILSDNPHYREVLYPYIIGEDLTSSINQSASRWVINFWDWPLNRNAKGSWRASTPEQRSKWIKDSSVPVDYPDKVAADFPELLEILAKKVKPGREKKKRKQYRDLWWQFAEKQKSLYGSLGVGHFVKPKSSGVGQHQQRTFALCQAMVAKYLAISVVPTNVVFSHKLVVFTLDPHKWLSLLQSTIHEIWARKHGGTLETRMSYSPSDVLETFPFPRASENLEVKGKLYLKLRSTIAAEDQIGLTGVYNGFHSRAQNGLHYRQLREIHQSIDEAVVAAYGWSDLKLKHDFYNAAYLPDADRERFTVSDDVRVELLQRLAQLNKERYQSEQKDSTARRTSSLSRHEAAAKTEDLFTAKGNG